MGGYRWQHGCVVDGSARGSQQLIDGPRLEGKIDGHPYIGIVWNFPP
jgi:hypothetical protein